MTTLTKVDFKVNEDRVVRHDRKYLGNEVIIGLDINTAKSLESQKTGIILTPNIEKLQVSNDSHTILGQKNGSLLEVDNKTLKSFSLPELPVKGKK